MGSGQNIGQPIELESPFELFRKQTGEALFGFINDAKELIGEEDEETLEVKKSELSERLRTACKFDVLKNLTSIINEYKRSKSVSKYGIYGGVILGCAAAASYAAASYLSGKPPVDALGIKIGYELVDKIFKVSTLGSLFGFLSYIKNKPDVSPYEKRVMDGMIGLFGEEALETKENIEKGMEVVKDVYSNIIEETDIYKILISL